MAETLSRRALERLPLKEYGALRGQLRTGDLLFASGDAWVSKIIRAATHSTWSHVGLVVVLDEWQRVLLLESVENAGVRLAPLSNYLREYRRGRRPYPGRAVLARVTGGEALGTAIAQHGCTLLTRPYDRIEIARVVWRLLAGRSRRVRDRAFVCSELVEDCYRAAGLKL